MRVVKFTVEDSPNVKIMNTARGGLQVREKASECYKEAPTKAPVMLNIVFRKTKTIRKSEYPLNQPTVYNMAALVSKSLEGVVYESAGQIIGIQAVKVWADESRPAGIYIEASLMD
jgi:hypothetical protein